MQPRLPQPFGIRIAPVNEVFVWLLATRHRPWDVELVQRHQAIAKLRGRYRRDARCRHLNSGPRRYPPEDEKLQASPQKDGPHRSMADPGRRNPEVAIGTIAQPGHVNHPAIDRGRIHTGDQQHARGGSPHVGVIAALGVAALLVAVRRKVQTQLPRNALRRLFQVRRGIRLEGDAHRSIVTGQQGHCLC